VLQIKLKTNNNEPKNDQEIQRHRNKVRQRIQQLKSISQDKAEEILISLERFCEIIFYTIKK